MKNFCLVFAIFLSLGLSVNNTSAQTKLYSFDTAIAVTGDGGYDYLFIDQLSSKLYVSHGTTVNVIDLKMQKVVGTISNMLGVHGIAVVNELGKGFISDGKANAVVVFDMNTYSTITTIPLTGKKPDAIMYDAFSNQIFAFNGGSNNVSVIDVNTLKEKTTIALDGGPEFAVADGKGKIYNNLEDKNSMKVIDSKELKVINTWPLPGCKAPSGLAIDNENQRLFTVGADSKTMSVVDAKSGKIIATLPIGSGVDAVTFDPETKLIFCSCGDGVTTIIKQESADKYSIAQTLVTQKRARTMALDTRTHNIYLSVADFVAGTRTPVAGSFKVLVYKLRK